MYTLLLDPRLLRKEKQVTNMEQEGNQMSPSFSLLVFQFTLFPTRNTHIKKKVYILFGVGRMGGMLRSEDNPWEYVLSFYHVSPKD